MLSLRCCILPQIIEVLQFDECTLAEFVKSVKFNKECFEIIFNDIQCHWRAMTDIDLILSNLFSSYFWVSDDVTKGKLSKQIKWNWNAITVIKSANLRLFPIPQSQHCKMLYLHVISTINFFTESLLVLLITAFSHTGRL